MVFGDAGVGQSCLPFPFVGLGLVQFSVLEGGLSEERIQIADIASELCDHSVTDSLRQLETLGSNFVSQMLGDSVVEIPDIAGLVFPMLGVFPNLTNLVCHPSRNRLAIHQPVQESMPVTLGQRFVTEGIEHFLTTLDVIQSELEGRT